jgi:hypothetical protein
MIGSLAVTLMAVTMMTVTAVTAADATVVAVVLVTEGSAMMVERDHVGDAPAL